jgi:hypothetical protein
MNSKLPEAQAETSEVAGDPGTVSSFRSAKPLLLAVFLCAASLVLAAAGCDPLGTDRVEVRFDNRSIGQNVVPTDSGDETDRLILEVLTLNDGVVTTVAGTIGQGRAADFPAHDGGVSGPRAIIRLSNTTNTDVLNPAASDFEFGADVRLDNTSATSGSRDDGNNVFQRGLFGDSSQYKLEVDLRNGDLKAICRIKGGSGAVEVKSEPLEAGDNYRLRCKRRGNTVRLQVTPITPSGTLGQTVETQESGQIGLLTFPLSVPASVGGKLWSTSGNIAASASDQFNGVLDNAFLAVS